MTEFKYKDIGVAADTLYHWLGTFWTHVVTNASRTAARNMQKGATLAAAQKQLDMLESLQFKDRNNVPVFHRDRWTPAVIYKNERNTGDATMVRLATGGGDEAYQLLTDNPLKLGAATPKTGYVYYPLDLSDLAKQPDCLCDNIFNPSKILIRDRDFVLRDNSIIFREADDPFTKLTYNINTDPGSGLEECVLWLFNAEVDRNYVYDSIGHVVNIYTESSEVCKRIINMVWDCYTNEANVGIISSLLGALYDIPTCLTDTETVEIVNTNTGLVVTDKNVYYADPAKLSVKAGDIVSFGDAFDTRLRLYGYPFDSSGLDGVTMEQALPAITLPASMFKTSLKLGPATLNRVPTDIVETNPTLATANLLYFSLDYVNTDFANFAGKALPLPYTNGVQSITPNTAYPSPGNLGWEIKDTAVAPSDVLLGVLETDADITRVIRSASMGGGTLSIIAEGAVIPPNPLNPTYITYNTSRPRFPIFQSVNADNRFWANLWAECEAVSPTTALSCFSDYITYNEGSVLPGTIKPLEWYLGFMAGTSTLVARVDASKPAGVPALSISKLLPAHARLIVLETAEVLDAVETQDSDVAPDPVDVPVITSSGDELAIADKVVALKWRS